MMNAEVRRLRRTGAPAWAAARRARPGTAPGAQAAPAHRPAPSHRPGSAAGAGPFMTQPHDDQAAADGTAAAYEMLAAAEEAVVAPPAAAPVVSPYAVPPASARRAPPARPPHPSPRGGVKSARGSPRHATTGRPTTAGARLVPDAGQLRGTSIANSVYRREDLHSLLYDVQAAAKKESRMAAAAERAALDDAIMRSHARSEALAAVIERERERDAAGSPPKKQRAPPVVHWADVAGPQPPPTPSPPSASRRPPPTCVSCTLHEKPSEPARASPPLPMAPHPSPAIGRPPTINGPPTYRPPPGSSTAGEAPPPAAVVVPSAPVAQPNLRPCSPRVRFHVPSSLAAQQALQPHHIMVSAMRGSRQPPQFGIGGANVEAPPSPRGRTHDFGAVGTGAAAPMTATAFPSRPPRFRKPPPLSRDIQIPIVSGQSVPPAYYSAVLEAWGTGRDSPIDPPR